MSRRRVRLAALVVCAVAILIGAPSATATDTSLAGQWYGVGTIQSNPAWSGRMEIQIVEYAPGLYYGWATYYDIGIIDTLVPVSVSGNVVTVGDPAALALIGVWSGNTISGTAAIPAAYPPYYELVDWKAWKDTGQGSAPGALPTTPCELPDLFTPGTAAWCSELGLFDPAESAGWVDYPANGETESDPYRSYLRRDLRQIVKYASTKVACATADWDDWTFAPLALGDMSEADGAIPGTSIGAPGHPPGTHTDGRDIDTGYYQLFSPNNYMRPIGRHWDAFGVDQDHLTAEPYALDVWRTALLLAYLAEHPRTRVIGVDGQAGPLLDEALDDLVFLGWIDADLRESIPLVYETDNLGYGFFYHHHHHLHLSVSPVVDIVSSVNLRPRTLNKKSKGKTITGFLELDAGYNVSLVDPARIALILDGHTLLYAESKGAKVGDHDGDGVPDLKVKFDRRKVLEAVGVGNVELTLTGVVSGTFFRETTTVRVKK